MARTARSVLVCAWLALVWGAAPAGAGEPAARAAGCSAQEVTVVVDFGPLGGGTSVRCAAGSPSSGLDALSKAGFGYGFRPGFAGMVCAINANPNPCNGAPADAYWAYWHAPAGGSWTYATQGAGSRTPAPGSVEGWAFGADRRPSIAPPRIAPPPTTSTSPPTTATVTTSPQVAAAPPVGATSPAPPGSAQEAEPNSSAAPSSASSSTPAPATSTTLTDESPSAPAGQSDRTGAGTDEPIEELALDQAASSRGSAAPGLVGVLVVVVVLAAGAWEFRRRRTP